MQLMPKFMPRSHIGIFRNGRTLPTPLDPKVMFQYVLQQVSRSYETIPNAPKHNETHQNMSLGSNGVDQVRWL